MAVKASDNDSSPDAPLLHLEVDGKEYREALQQKLRQLQPGETMAAYSTRVGDILDLQQCRVVRTIEAPGIYIYKRPVRGALTAGNLLSHAGSIFHHIVLYIKSAEALVALEMGPNGDADVASNIFEAVESGPVELHAATLPNDGSPLLHVDVPHHPLSHPAVRSAIAFAQAQQYHTVHSNCIQFADFMVRLLSGGAVFGAPLAYDVKCGVVPPVDSPLLSMLGMMRLTWLDVCDGSRLMAQFLAQHEPPPALAPPRVLSSPELPPLPVHGAAGGSTTDFLAAALSAARSGGAMEPASAGGDASSKGGPPETPVPDLPAMLRSAFAAAQQNGGAPVGSEGGLAGMLAAALAGSKQNGTAPGGGMGSQSGMPGMLREALTGELREVAIGDGSAHGGQAVGNGIAGGIDGMPLLPARKPKRV